MTAYSVILADVSWKFGDNLPGPKRGASSHYETLELPQIESFLDDNEIAPAKECWLFFWRVAAMQPEALTVVRRWGFTVKSEIVWCKTTSCKECGGVGWKLEDSGYGSGPSRTWCELCEGRGWKQRIGMGHYTRNSHEVCLIATRGKVQTMDHSLPSVLFAPRQEHSRKPDLLYHWIDRLTGNLTPRVELFARRRWPGWDVHGLEVPELPVEVANV